MRRAIVIVLLALAAVVLVPLVGGWMLPRSHVAIVSAELSAPPDSVWNVITRVADYPAWRSGISRSEVTVVRDGLPSWNETSSEGTIAYEAVEGEPGRRLVTRIATEGLPYGGSWTYVLTPTVDGGTTLTITENGEVYNPIFRFLARYAFGHTATMERFVADLRARLGPGSATGAAPPAARA